MPDSLLDPHAPDERLERWLDGDLPAGEAVRVAEAVQHHEAWKQAAATARHVQKLLRTVPAPVAPPDFTASVLREVAQRERDVRVPLAEYLFGWLRRPVWQPALVLAVLLLVAVALWPRPPQPTQEEVAVTLEEVRWTLAYLSRTSEKTGLMVRDRVIVPRVVAPVQQAIEGTLQEKNLPQP